MSPLKLLCKTSRKCKPQTNPSFTVRNKEGGWQPKISKIQKSHLKIRIQSKSTQRICLCQGARRGVRGTTRAGDVLWRVCTVTEEPGPAATPQMPRPLGTHRHSLEGLHDDPVDLVKQLAGHLPATGALQVEPQVTHCPLAPMDVVVVLLVTGGCVQAIHSESVTCSFTLDTPWVPLGCGQAPGPKLQRGLCLQLSTYFLSTQLSKSFIIDHFYPVVMLLKATQVAL
jgi:hypothetical protein